MVLFAEVYLNVSQRQRRGPSARA